MKNRLGYIKFSARRVADLLDCVDHHLRLFDLDVGLLSATTVWRFADAAEVIQPDRAAIFVPQWRD